jgi:hypothetical protein
MPPNQSAAQIAGGQYRKQRADQRWQTIRPNRAACWNADGFQRMHRRGLRPVNANGFLVAFNLAQLDPHVIAGFHHLTAGLGEAAFIAIPGRDGKETRQPDQKAQQRQPPAWAARFRQTV